MKYQLNINGLQDQFPFNLKIINLDGMVVFEQKIKVNETVIEPDLKPALYLIKFQGKRVKHTQKLIVE